MDSTFGILEQILELKENHNYDRMTLNDIADEMEEIIGEACMWRTLRPGLSVDELIENLEFVIKEEDLESHGFSGDIKQLRESHSYDRAKLEEMTDSIEELIGEAVIWQTLRLGFSTDELLENLEYIAREEDL